MSQTSCFKQRHTKQDKKDTRIISGKPHVDKVRENPGRGGGLLPYMGYIYEGYGFQAVYSGIGYINQRVWV